MEDLATTTMQVRAAADSSQYLTFKLGDEEYGIEILKVQEIRGYSFITPIPNTPPFVKGVMNLRGTIIPIVELRSKFEMAAAEYNQFTVIIVVNIGGKVLGLIVDAVSDVLDIPKDDIQAAPEFGSEVDAQFIDGMARTEEKLVVLLDIPRVLSGIEFDGQ